jgi:hypothetical protein
LPANTDANCSYVTSYAEQSASGIYTGTDADHHPVVYVDWCDAKAYCQGVGKRLCGAVAGGATPYASYADVTQSQWDRACTSGGLDAYPYGNTYVSYECDGADYGTSQTIAVASIKCSTSQANVYDMSGNVWEWEDSCAATGSSANCRVRGGSFKDSNTALACTQDAPAVRTGAYYSVGFRCCEDIGISGPATIAAGEYHTCAIANGGVQCWGDNEYGQLGNNSTALYSVIPVQVQGLMSGITAIAAGYNHSCAVVNGGVRCWGYNYDGQLGNNSITNSPIPVQVQGLTSSVTAIAAGGGHSCAVVNGGVQCWGYNGDGELGNNSTTSSGVPVQVQ